MPLSPKCKINKYQAHWLDSLKVNIEWIFLSGDEKFLMKKKSIFIFFLSKWIPVLVIGCSYDYPVNLVHTDITTVYL